MATNSLGWFYRDDLPDPGTSPELFDGVLLRRVVAWFVDCLIVGILLIVASLILAVAGVLTFGVAWLGYFIVVPAVFIFYYAVTLGSRARATLGMQFMDIVLTPTRTRPLEGWHAILHVIVFWVTLNIPFVQLIALFTPRRQMLHDLIVGTLMVRRSPMERFWAEEAADHPQFNERFGRYS